MKNLVVIAGPTAVGKTPLALDLALHFNTSIISADSRQCFRELGIAVAKPTAEQLSLVNHYFINSHSVHEAVDAKVFEVYAREKLSEIFSNNNMAIMVGGTGLYLQALLFGLDDVPTVDPSLRHRLRDEYKLKGLQWLQGELQKMDPAFYASGEIQNPNRSLRALEVIMSSGKSILSFHSKPGLIADYNIISFNLQMERALLYERINQRVDAMAAAGLVEEARQLYPLRHLNALQTVGYKELFDFFENKMSLEDALQLVKQNTRHYAKRQVTWFKKMPGFMPVETNYSQMLTTIEKSVK